MVSCSSLFIANLLMYLLKNTTIALSQTLPIVLGFKKQILGKGNITIGGVAFDKELMKRIKLHETGDQAAVLSHFFFFPYFRF